VGGAGSEFPLGGEEAGVDLLFVAALAEDIPTFGVSSGVFFDVGFGCLKGVVGSVVGAVEEEGGLFFVLINEVDGVVGDDVGGIKGLSFVSDGDFPRFAVEAEGFVTGEEIGGPGEVAPVALEAEVGGLFGEVPFAHHHGVVVGGGENFGDGCSAGE